MARRKAPGPDGHHGRPRISRTKRRAHLRPSLLQFSAPAARGAFYRGLQGEASRSGATHFLLPPAAQELFRACGHGSLLAPACKGRFRAPARPTFAPVGKSGQKRRSNLRFENPLAPRTWYFALLYSSRCYFDANLSKCRIAPAAIPAAAQGAKYRTTHFYIFE